MRQGALQYYRRWAAEKQAELQQQQAMGERLLLPAAPVMLAKRQPTGWWRLHRAPFTSWLGAAWNRLLWLTRTRFRRTVLLLLILGGEVYGHYKAVAYCGGLQFNKLAFVCRALKVLSNWQGPPAKMTVVSAIPSLMLLAHADNPL